MFVGSYHLSDVFHDELACPDRLLGLDPPPLGVGHEPLEAVGELVLLDLVVGALVAGRAGPGVALGVGHAVDAVLATSGSVVRGHRALAGVRSGHKLNFSLL